MKNKTLSFETYGKQNTAHKVYNELKDRFKINPYSKVLIEKQGLSCYVPKLNKARVGIAILIMVACIITPFTNWLIPFVLMWGLK